MMLGELPRQIRANLKHNSIFQEKKIIGKLSKRKDQYGNNDPQAVYYSLMDFEKPLLDTRRGTKAKINGNSYLKPETLQMQKVFMQSKTRKWKQRMMAVSPWKAIAFRQTFLKSRLQIEGLKVIFIILKQMGEKATTLLLVCVLLGCGNTLNWYGTGNWTPGNITFINQLLATVDMTATPIRLSQSVQSVSNQLNKAWDPAWNVVIGYHYDRSNYDVVLYGYGFNEHWFWQNGVLNRDNMYLSFIIWKDYNCITWYTVNPRATNYQPTSYQYQIQNSIEGSLRNTAGQRDPNDVWLFAQDVQSRMPSTTSGILQDKLGYSIVASQGGKTYLVGRVCAKDYLVMDNIGMGVGGYAGNVLIMQMRDK